MAEGLVGQGVLGNEEEVIDGIDADVDTDAPEKEAHALSGGEVKRDPMAHIRKARFYKELTDRLMAERGVTLYIAATEIANSGEYKVSNQGIMNLVWGLEIIDSSPLVQRLLLKGILPFQSILRLREGVAKYGLRAEEILEETIALRGEASDFCGGEKLKKPDEIEERIRPEQVDVAVMSLAGQRDPKRLNDPKEIMELDGAGKNSQEVEMALNSIKKGIARLLKTIKVLREDPTKAEEIVRERIYDQIRETRRSAQDVLEDIFTKEQGLAELTRNGNLYEYLVATDIRMAEFIGSHQAILTLIRNGRLNKAATTELKMICEEYGVTPQQVLARVLSDRAAKKGLPPRSRYGIEELIGDGLTSYTVDEIRSTRENPDGLRGIQVNEETTDEYNPLKASMFAKHGVNQLKEGLKKSPSNRNIVAILRQLRGLLLETSRTISEAVFPLEETKNRPTFAEHLALFLEEIKDFGRITVAMQRLIEAADGDNGVVFFTQDEMGETDLEILERRLRDSEVILEKYSIVRRKRPEDKGKEYRKEIGLRLEWKTEEKRKEEERRELAAARKLKAAKRAEEKRAEEEKNAAEAARLAEEARKKAEELKKAQEEARRKEKEKVAAEQAARVEKEAALAHARAEHEARLNYGYTIQTSFGKHIISVRTEPDFYRSLLAVQEAIRPLPSVQQADVEQVRAVRTRIEQGDKGTSGLIQPWREDTNTITIRRALRALDDMIIMMEKRVRKAEGELPKLRTFASPFGEEAERATGQLYADTFIYETPAPDKLKGVQLRVITRQHPGHKGNFPSGSQVVVMPMDSQANKSFEGEGIIVQTDILRVIGITERTPVKREQRVAGLYKDKTTYKVKTQAVKFEGLWNFRIRIMGSAHPDFAKVNVRAGHVPIVLINEEEAEVGYGTVPGNILESIVVPGLEQQAPQPAQAQQPTQGPRPPSQPTQAPTKPSSPSTPPASPSHITVQDIPLDQRGRDRGWTPRPKPQFQDRRPPFSPGGPRGPQGRPHGNSHGRRNDRRDDRHERPSRQQEELTGLCRTSREIELEDGTILPKNQMVEIIPKDSETAQLWLMETGEAGIGSKYRLIKILGGSSRMAKVLKNHLEPL